jgi:PHD/YefM family antitoxin component YafN of YafNO toxin-antitoxin module
MIHLSNIHPLTEFKRKTAEFRERLKSTGLPAVLTIEGRPEIVVQDAVAYQKLLDLVDQAEALQAIQEGLEDARSGRTIPLERFDRSFRRRHRIRPRK